MSDIEWRDPPDRQKGRVYFWEKRLAPLMERPNEWAMVRTYDTNAIASTAAWQLRKGQLKHPPGRWEFVSRRNELFARYLGSEES